MKIISSLLAIFIAMVFVLTGCQLKSDTPVLSSGFYCAKTDDDTSSSPYIALDIEKNEFIFCSSMMVSYAEVGKYTTKKNTLIAVSQNATFTFEIQNEKTLVLIDKGTDNYFKFPVGTTFVFNEKLG